MDKMNREEPAKKSLEHENTTAPFFSPKTIEAECKSRVAYGDRSLRGRLRGYTGRKKDADGSGTGLER